jgi:hypothetical protein
MIRVNQHQKQHLHVSKIQYNTSRVSYPFVDWIRMIAMIGIVWAHIPITSAKQTYNPTSDILKYCFFMDFWKFGVICFFMISGFLLSNKIENSNPVDYFLKRISGTVVPYVFVVLLTIVLYAFKNYILNIPSNEPIVRFIYETLLISPLWFLPNYWLSLIIILSLKRFLKKWVLGASLFIITILFSQYFTYGNDPIPHMFALFAYVFYVWLGFIISKKGFHLYIQKLNISYLLLTCVGLYIMSSLESIYLYKRGSSEYFSILRYSNQMYSVTMFITMMAIFNKPLNSKFVKPRNETFGIFLYHIFALRFVIFISNHLDRFGIHANNFQTFIVVFLIKFIICYVLTLLLVKLLFNYNIGFLRNTVQENKVQSSRLKECS